MPQTTFVVDDPTEALVLEQALGFARQLSRIAQEAPNGQVLARAELCALHQGRAFLRQALQTVLQAQASDVEKKGRPSAAAAAAADATTKANQANKP